MRPHDQSLRRQQHQQHRQQLHQRESKRPSQQPRQHQSAQQNREERNQIQNSLKYVHNDASPNEMRALSHGARQILKIRCIDMLYNTQTQ